MVDNVAVWPLVEVVVKGLIDFASGDEVVTGEVSVDVEVDEIVVNPVNYVLSIQRIQMLIILY